MTDLLILGAAVGAFSFTIVKLFTDIRPLKEYRLRLVGRNDFLSKLLSCPYCLSHYVAAIATLIVRLHPVAVDVPYVGWLIELAITWMALVAIAGLVAGTLKHLYLAQESVQKRQSNEL